MRDRTTKFLSLTSLAFSLLFLWCLPVKASLEPAGHVILANGPFIAIQTNASARSLSRGSEFYQGDRLWTGPRTRAQIRFSDGAIMTLRPDTEFSVDEYQFDEKNAENNTSFFTLIKGGFRTLTGLISKLRPDGYRVKTAYAIVGVRGTTYEVVDQSALYVAAWEGTISITNNSSEMLLGFGQDYNYATVTSINSAPKGSVEVPPPLQQTPDPGLQVALVDPTETRLVTSVQDPIIDIIPPPPPRLTSAETASLDRTGFAAFTGTGTVTTTVTGTPVSLSQPLSGSANDIATGGNPILFDPTAGPDGTVLRQGTAPALNVSTNTTLGSAFPVSLGEWDGGTSPATLQPNAFDGSDTASVDSPVFWMTLFPATSLAIATGSVSYNNVLNFKGDGSGGVVTALSLDGTLDFNTGALNGNMLITNADTWNVNFSGGLSGAQFTATAGAGSTFNGGGAVTGTLTGSLTGDASGFGAQAPLGMGGVFDFESGANDVAGTFLARHDARFFAGEVASLDRPGFAAFGGPAATLFGGTANDGASGIPIVFDQVGDQVLRRQTPAAGDTVIANFNGFNASFGSWDGATSAAVILPDPDGFVQQAVVDPVYWITLGPPVTLPTGSVAYFAAGAALGAVGSGSGGSSITMTRFQADIDFAGGPGNLTNGRMLVANGTNNWDAFFNGTAGAGGFTASLTAGSNVNGSAAVGNLEGAFTDNGTGISGIGGVFDFEQSGTPTTNVQGAFVAREDRRFAVGELASLNQVGIAATSSPTATAPFVGEASDGAGGSPIVFDVAANQVLRQGTAPLLGSVTTNTTLGAGFAVSWGAWNASIGNEASIQGDPNTATATQLISDPVYWVTAAATPATSLPTGTFTYGTVLGFQGSGEAGPVNALAVNINATLNLGTGAITNGTMSVQNGPRVSGFVDQWIADLGGGSFASGQLNVNVTTGTVSVDGAAPVGGVTGNVNGVLTGPNGEGLAGGFNLQQGPTNHVGGTFLVRQ